jgi:hypothetical protein
MNAIPHAPRRTGARPAAQAHQTICIIPCIETALAEPKSSLNLRHRLAERQMAHGRYTATHPA